MLCSTFPHSSPPTTPVFSKDKLVTLERFDLEIDFSVMLSYMYTQQAQKGGGEGAEETFLTS